MEEGSVLVLARCLENLLLEWFKATADALFQARNKKFNKCQPGIWDHVGVHGGVGVYRQRSSAGLTTTLLSNPLLPGLAISTLPHSEPHAEPGEPLAPCPGIAAISEKQRDFSEVRFYFHG